jgi:YD repeat-containing protein
MLEAGLCRASGTGGREMVAIVTSGGLGLDRSSAGALGALGLFGQAGLGQAGDNVYVNAANGNLVISSTDEMLFGTGANAVFANTYNSQGQLGDNWQDSASRSVGALTGSYGATGSTVTRTDGDGSQVVFTWNATDNAYVAKENGGADDTLTLSGSTWTWTDGSTQATETYDASNGGRILTSVDNNGEGLTFSYNASGQISRVTTQTGEYTNFVYSGSNLTELDTFSYASTGSGTASGSLVQSTRVRYGYNASNQLTSVTVDLTPNDNSITDGNTYVTNYGYDANGHVTSITQSDGTSLQIGYTQVGGVYRVTSLTQAVSSGVSRTTTFSYDTTNRVTTVTDPTGQTTKLTYDASGNLLKIDQAPAVSGGSDQVTSFTYDANGDVLTKTLPGGQTTTYQYDGNGNCIYQQDSLGDTVTRTYNATDQLLTETTYTATAAAGATPTSGAQTSYYAYDAHDNLRYTISAQGDVTQYNYNASGQLTSTLQPTANTYAVSGLSPSSPPTAAQLDSWFTGLADLSKAERTDTTYDFRGNVASTTTYSQLTTAGVGVTTSGVSKVVYIYDQGGRLLSKLITDQTGAGTAQTYAYDGLGRVITATDPDGHAASTTYTAASNTTTVTDADGIVQTDVYDLAGELVSSSATGPSAPTATTTYKYDAQGNLRIATDPMGLKTYYLYDATGRKVAQILPDGSITEYVYNADDQVVSTIAYATRLTSAQLASLVDANGNPTSVTLASIRPAAASGDQRSYGVYDGAGRVIETIDPAGAVTTYAYDGASDLVSTTAYANTLSSATLSGFVTTPPTGLVLPTANPSADRSTRYFYDADGRQVASLDPDGYLTQVVYDSAGRKTQTLLSANAASSSLWATGTLAQLQASVGTSSSDIQESLFYDDRGLLTTSVDGSGRATTYAYNDAGQVISVTDGAGDVAQSSYDAAGNLIQSIDPRGVVTTYTYNHDNQLLTQTVDPTGLDLVTQYGYDGLGRLVTVKDPAGTVTTTNYDLDGRKTSVVVDSSTGGLNLTTTYAYDADSRVTSMTEGSGTAAARTTTYAYDALGRLVTTTVDTGSGHFNLATNQTYDADGNLAAVTDPAGAVTRKVYNAFGQQVYAIDAMGDVTQTVYDGDGRVTETISYATPLSASTLTSLGLTPSVAAVAADIATSSADRATAYTYDQTGRILSQTVDPGSGHLALTTNYAYDGAGNLLSVTDPAGYVTRYIYDAAGRRAYSIDATGAVTAVAYDADGNVVSETQYATDYTASGNPTLANMQSWASANSTSADRTTQNVYDSAGRLAFQIDAQGDVTGYTYDPDGRQTQQTRYTARYTGASGPSLSVMQGWVSANAAASTDETTRTTYDTAGRVTDTYDALGVRTHYTYDGLGNVLTVTAAYGTSSAEVTQNTYDTAGRLSSTAVNSGGLNLTTNYAYDPDGRITQVTDPNGHVTQTTYDADGRVLSTVVDPGSGHLNITTRFQYDAFGDKVMATDPNGNITYFYYDNAGRLTLQVDPMGYATQTVYDPDGNATSVTRYYIATTGAAVGAPPTITTDAGYDITTSSTYDHLGRVTSTTDAQGNTVHYVLDAFGDQVQVTNQLGGVTTNVYDNLGRLKSQTQTITGTDVLNGTQFQAGVTQVATNTYSYDAWGNLSQKVLASGAPEQQTISYTYDLDNRQLSQSEVVYVGSAQTVPPSAATTTATQSVTYDALGNVILTTDANGNKTYDYYDGANRKIAEVAASGALTTFAYDHKDNVVAKVTYATTVTPTGPGGAPPTLPTGGSRTIQYVYDAADRLTQTIQPNVQYAYLSGSTLLYGTTSIINQTLYDADGNVRQTIDGNGNISYAYYDADSRKTAQVDAGGYLTTYQLDAAGNVLTETQYATAATNVTWSGFTAPTSSANDRITTYTYDRNGRTLTQTRDNVQASTVSSTGALSTNTANSTVTYTYDAMGDVLSVTQASLAPATGDYTDYTYDSAGRQVHTQQTSYTDYEGNTRVPATDTAYNELGLATQSIVRGDGTASTPDRVTTTVYGAGGRVVSVSDPTGFAQTSSYDANGNLVGKQYGRLLSNGTVETDSAFITYDSMNREISRKNGSWNGSAWTYGDTTDQYYDAYGEVVAQGTNTGGNIANAQEYADYDNAGRVWLTNMSGGVSRAYAYDKNNNSTVLFQTVGTTNLKNASSLSSLFTDSSGDITETITVYNSRNEVTNTIQPSSSESYTPIQAQELDTPGDPTIYYNGNVGPASGGGIYMPYTAGGGSAPVGQATSYGGTGGSITVTPSYNVQTMVQEYYTPYGPVAAYFYNTVGYLTINATNAGLIPGGTVTAVGVVNGQTQSQTIGSFTAASGQQSFMMWNSGWVSSPTSWNYYGSVSLTESGPWGTVSLGAVSVQGTAGSTAVPHNLELQGISSSATNVLCFARPSGSSGPYLEIGATETASGSWNINADTLYGWSNGSWEIRYMAFDGSGDILDSADGVMSQGAGGTPQYSPTSDSLYGPGQAMVVNVGATTYLIVAGMPSGTTYVNMRYSTSGGYPWTGSTTLTNGGWGQAGLYYVPVTNWGANYFWLQPMNSSGMVGSEYSFGAFSSGSNASWELQAGWQGNRQFILYPPTPPAGTTVATQYFRYSTNNGTSWSNWASYSGSGNQTVDLSSLTDFADEISGLYQYQTVSSTGQELSFTTGTFSLGYNGQTASVTSQAQDIPAEVAFQPQQSGVASLNVYYRLQVGGSYSGAFTEVTLTNPSSSGVFAFNIDQAGLRPTSGQNNVEYYYDAYDANGKLIPPVSGSDHVHGYLQIQSNQYVATTDDSIQWVAQAVQNSQFEIDRQQSWNAFGEVASTTDGRGDVTNMAYNTLGELTTTTSPQVTAVSASGVASTVTPTQTTYYDISGRKVGEMDADGNVTTDALLADTGYDGQAAQTVTQFNADGSQTRTGFDVLGEARTITTAYGTSLAATTDNTYDGDGNLIEVDHPERVAGGNSPVGLQLKDYYAYDGLGQRISHTEVTNDATPVNLTETTDYDLEGRVIRTVDLAGLTTTYGYTWETGSQLGSDALGAYGGWQKTTTNSAGLTSTEDDDEFGNVVQDRDYGSHLTLYTYNQAGELVIQASVGGQNLTYAYYANGYLASVTDNTLKMKSTYEYDNDGNRTVETANSIAASPVYYENEVITYDAMDRVTEIKDPEADITYSYDAQGNRREVKTVYTDGVATDPVVASTDYWYAYDSMNRFVVTMGQLSGGQIIAGTTGTAITYDVAGNRHSAAYTDSGGLETDVYSYSADGYLEDTTLNGTLSTARTNDALGRVTQISGTNGVTTYAYDGDNRVTTESTTNTAGTITTAVTNSYKNSSGVDQGVLMSSTSTTSGSGVSSPTTTTTANTYAWWGSALLTQSVQTTGTTSVTALAQTYDVNGHLSQTVNPGYTTNYTDDALGEVLVRQQWIGSALAQRERDYWFNGHQVGDINSVGQSQLNSNYTASTTDASQTDYAQTLAPTDPTMLGKGDFRDALAVTGQSVAPFIISSDPGAPQENVSLAPVSDGGPGLASQDYVLTASDAAAGSGQPPLERLAQAFWGDSALWYLIADANGLTLQTPLAAGMSLIIPNKVANFHNNASTYSPSTAINDDLPTQLPLVLTLPSEDQSAFDAVGLTDIGSGSVDASADSTASNGAVWYDINGVATAADPNAPSFGATVMPAATGPWSVAPPATSSPADDDLTDTATLASVQGADASGATDYNWSDYAGVSVEDLPLPLQLQFVPVGESANTNRAVIEGVAWGTPPGVEGIDSMLGAGPMSVVDGGDFNETAHGDYNEGAMDQIYAALGAGNVALTPQQAAQVAALDGTGGYSLENAGLTMTTTSGPSPSDSSSGSTTSLGSGDNNAPAADGSAPSDGSTPSDGGAGFNQAVANGTGMPAPDPSETPLPDDAPPPGPPIDVQPQQNITSPQIVEPVPVANPVNITTTSTPELTYTPSDTYISPYPDAGPMPPGFGDTGANPGLDNLGDKVVQTLGDGLTPDGFPAADPSAADNGGRDGTVGGTVEVQGQGFESNDISPSSQDSGTASSLDLVKSKSQRWTLQQVSSAALSVAGDFSYKGWSADPWLVSTVIAGESNGDPNPPNNPGHQGFGQIGQSALNQLAKIFPSSFTGNEDLTDPMTNVRATTAYLSFLVGLHGGDVASALVAYGDRTLSYEPGYMAGYESYLSNPGMTIEQLHDTIHLQTIL